MADNFTGLPPETVCMQLTQQKFEDGEALSYYVGSACGSPRLTVTADVYVGTGEDGSWAGSALLLDACEDGTLIRFTYHSAMDLVQVWSLPPAPKID